MAHDSWVKNTFVALKFYDKIECMTKVIMQNCECWPNSIGIEKRDQYSTFKNCDFLKHAKCVAPRVSNFEPSKHW